MIRLAGIAKRIGLGLTVTPQELSRMRSACYLAGATEQCGLFGTPAELLDLYCVLGMPDDAGRPTIFETTTKDIEQ